MKFKAKKRVILSDSEPFLTLKFAKKMFSRAILPYLAVAKVTAFLLFAYIYIHAIHANALRRAHKDIFRSVNYAR